MKKNTKHSELLKHVATVQKQVAATGKNVSMVLAKMKAEYKRMDPATKKKIAAGVAGLGIILAATVKYHKHRKKG